MQAYDLAGGNELFGDLDWEAYLLIQGSGMGRNRPSNSTGPSQRERSELADNPDELTSHHAPNRRSLGILTREKF